VFAVHNQLLKQLIELTQKTQLLYSMNTFPLNNLPNHHTGGGSVLWRAPYGCGIKPTIIQILNLKSQGTYLPVIQACVFKP